MLPLTRNIFRQTATPFNNATKRWEQESYDIQIKWSRAAICGSLKKFTRIHRRNDVKGWFVATRASDLRGKGTRRVTQFGGFPTDHGAQFVWWKGAFGISWVSLFVLC